MCGARSCMTVRRGGKYDGGRCSRVQSKERVPMVGGELPYNHEMIPSLQEAFHLTWPAYHRARSRTRVGGRTFPSYQYQATKQIDLASSARDLAVSSSFPLLCPRHRAALFFSFLTGQLLAFPLLDPSPSFLPLHPPSLQLLSSCLFIDRLVLPLRRCSQVDSI
jgi:hypothetical protein